MSRTTLYRRPPLDAELRCRGQAWTIRCLRAERGPPRAHHLPVRQMRASALYYPAPALAACAPRIKSGEHLHVVRQALAHPGTGNLHEFGMLLQLRDCPHAAIAHTRA